MTWMIGYRKTVNNYNDNTSNIDGIGLQWT